MKVLGIDIGTQFVRMSRAQGAVKSRPNGVLPSLEKTPFHEAQQGAVPNVLELGSGPGTVKSYGQTARDALRTGTGDGHFAVDYKAALSGTPLPVSPYPAGRVPQADGTPANALRWTGLLLDRLRQQMQEASIYDGDLAANGGSRLVVGAPAGWALPARQELANVVARAFGHSRCDLVTDAQAALCWHAWRQQKADPRELLGTQDWLVVDCGASATELVVCAWQPEGPQPRGSRQVPIGGTALDLALMSYVAEQLGPASRSVPFFGLLDLCKSLKEYLCQAVAHGRPGCRLPLSKHEHGWDGEAKLSLSVATFEGLGALNQWRAGVDAALAALNVSPERLGGVLLTGGGSKGYWVSPTFSQWLGSQFAHKLHSYAQEGAWMQAGGLALAPFYFEPRSLAGAAVSQSPGIPSIAVPPPPASNGVPAGAGERAPLSPPAADASPFSAPPASGGRPRLSPAERALRDQAKGGAAEPAPKPAPEAGRPASPKRPSAADVPAGVDAGKTPPPRKEANGAGQPSTPDPGRQAPPAAEPRKPAERSGPGAGKGSRFRPVPEEPAPGGPLRQEKPPSRFQVVPGQSTAREPARNSRFQVVNSEMRAPEKGRPSRFDVVEGLQYAEGAAMQHRTPETELETGGEPEARQKFRFETGGM